MKIVLLLPLLAVAACGAPAATVTDAERAATGFLEAVEARDGARACDLVAPETRLKLEQEEQQPCPQAVLAVDLPEPGTVARTQVFGHEGLVVTSEQTVFLSRLDLGWRVTAAGCTARGEKPHDCEVEGA